MKKYYTRACNFYFNKTSKENIKKKISLPLGGNSFISFDCIEIISRETKKKINIKNIEKLPLRIKKKILFDIKNISKNKKIPGLKFKNFPLLMGILNLTPDSFSDGGKFNKIILARKQINKLIKSLDPKVTICYAEEDREHCMQPPSCHSNQVAGSLSRRPKTLELATYSPEAL